jgi:outer membrane protein TolC
VEAAVRELAERQLAEADSRVAQLGTIAQADVLQFASELASIEESLAQVESDKRSRALELGRLLQIGPARAELLSAASEEPSGSLTGSAAEVADRARRSSAALLQLEAEVEAARERARVAEDTVLPRLDLTASFGVTGLWNAGGDEPSDLPEGRPALTGLGGLELELPLGNARARAQLAEARAEAEAAQARYEERAQAIETEAARLWEQGQTASRRLDLARRTVGLARRLAEAERERERLGTTTPFQVMQAQESQRQAELRLLRAVVDRQAAALAIDQLTGELLARHSDDIADQRGTR